MTIACVDLEHESTALNIIEKWDDEISRCKEDKTDCL